MYETVSTLNPIVGTVRTTSPACSLYLRLGPASMSLLCTLGEDEGIVQAVPGASWAHRIVVLPAASKPSMSTRTCSTAQQRIGECTCSIAPFRSLLALLFLSEAPGPRWGGVGWLLSALCALLCRQIATLSSRRGCPSRSHCFAALFSVRYFRPSLNVPTSYPMQ